MGTLDRTHQEMNAIRREEIEDRKDQLDIWSSVARHIAEDSSEWKNLKLDLQELPGGGPAVALLAERLLHEWMRSDIDLGTLSSLGKALQEVTWEKLHSGIWRDVSDVWRDAYSLSCILEAAQKVVAANEQINTVSVPLQLQDQQREKHDEEEEEESQNKKILGFTSAVRDLDMAALMGGSAFRPLTDALISDLVTRMNHPRNPHLLYNSNTVVVPQSHTVPLVLEETSDAGIILGEKLSTGSPSFIDLPPGSMGPRGVPIPEEDLPSLDSFAAQYLCKTPVVITGAMLGWPALHRWKRAEYWRAVAGPRTVPVEIGKSYMEEGWGQLLMLFSEFLDKHLIPAQERERCFAVKSCLRFTEGETAGVGREGQEKSCGAASLSFKSNDENELEDESIIKNVLPSTDDHQCVYLAQHDLFSQIPALADDIIEPEYCVLGHAMRAVNTWIGPPGTITPPHTDPYQNLLCQVIGRKYVRLYSPDQTQALYPDE